MQKYRSWSSFINISLNSKKISTNFLHNIKIYLYMIYSIAMQPLINKLALIDKNVKIILQVFTFLK